MDSKLTKFDRVCLQKAVAVAKETLKRGVNYELND